MLYRILSLFIGYVSGCFLTAEPVTKHYTGKRPCEIGSGNPGMANVMDHVGKKAGFLVLFGDLLKTLFACLLCNALFGASIGRIAILYAGIGTMFGHNYPFWNHFKGGKGVAVTCLFMTAYLPLWGFLCCVAGGVVVALTGYLSVGGIVIPILYLIPAFLCGGIEAGILGTISAVVMIIRHYSSLTNRLHHVKNKSLNS